MAQADPGIRALVLLGNDKAFSAGADMSEFEKLAQATFPQSESPDAEARQQDRAALRTGIQELARQSGWGFAQADIEPLLNA